MVTTWTRPKEGQDIRLTGKAAVTVPAEQVLPGLRKKWDAFEGSLRKSLERAIDFGKKCIAEKVEVDHGQFKRLFAGHDDAVDGAIPCSYSWASKNMRMASNPLVSKSSHESFLPNDLNAVYELALMSAPALEQAIEDGKVTPQTTREEAKALRKEAAGEKAVREKPPVEHSMESDREQVECLCAEFAIGIARIINRTPDLKQIILTHLRLITKQVEQ